MKLSTFFLPCAFAFLILQFSCQKDSGQHTDKALEAIPVNATSVTAFDLPTLLDKANFEAIKKMDFYRFYIEKAGEESDALALAVANPENAGIDLSQNAYLSIELSPDNPEEIYTGIIFNLSSPEDFENFARSFQKIRIKEKSNYHLADLNQSTQIVWNEQIGVIAFGEELYEKEEVLDAFFAPSTETSLSNQERLNQLLSEKHDITTWLTSNAVAQNKNAKLVLSLAKIKPEALNDNFVHGYMDFEVGKVIAQLNYFFQDALVEDFRLLFKDHVKTNFSPYISEQNLNSYLTLALDFDGLDAALAKRPQVKLFADFALKNYGLSVNKLKAALDGDLVFTTYTGNVNNRQEGLIALKLKDLVAFESLLTEAEENELVTKTQRGRYRIAPSLHQALTELLPIDIGSSFDNQLLLKDDIAFFSGNIERLDAIELEKVVATQQLPTNAKILTQQNPIALFLDFNSLKRVGVPGAFALDLLTFVSNGKGADFDMGMKNKTTNSLAAIFEAINQAFLENREQRQPVSQEKS